MNEYAASFQRARNNVYQGSIFFAQQRSARDRSESFKGWKLAIYVPCAWKKLRERLEISPFTDDKIIYTAWFIIS